MDPGRGPGTDFERILAGVISPPLFQLAPLRQEQEEEGDEDGGACPAAAISTVGQCP